MPPGIGKYNMEDVDKLDKNIPEYCITGKMAFPLYVLSTARGHE